MSNHKPPAPRQPVNRKQFLIIGSILMALLTIIVVLVIYKGYKEFGWPPSIMIPIVGLLTFFGTLTLTGVTTPNSDLQKGEMRKAITAAIMAVYFFVMALTLFASSSPVFKLVDRQIELAKASSASTAAPAATAVPAATSAPDSEGSADAAPPPAASLHQEAVDSSLNTINIMLESLNNLVLVIVTFYFGSRTVEELNKQIQERLSKKDAAQKPAPITDTTTNAPQTIQLGHGMPDPGVVTNPTGEPLA